MRKSMLLMNPSWMDHKQAGSGMITCEKRFGSYVLRKDGNSLYSEPSYILGPMVEEEYASSCVIPNRWIDLKLLSKRTYNDNTSIFEFALPPGESVLNLPVLGHLIVKAPGKEHDGGDAIRPYTSISPFDKRGSFEILVKRYDQWGQKEAIQTHFLFTRTDHTFRPAGAVSNHIHQLNIGDTLLFRHSSECVKRVGFPFQGVKTITMLAVGVGIAPMIRVLRAVFDESNIAMRDVKIVLLYGLREKKDILMKEYLDEMQEKSSNGSPPPTALQFPHIPNSPHVSSAATNGNEMLNTPPSILPPATKRLSSSSSSICEACEKNGGEAQLSFALTPSTPSEKRPSFGSPRRRSNSGVGQGSKGDKRFNVVYCIGSRWSNVIMGAKTSNPKGPELLKKIEGLEKGNAEVGWIDEEKIKKYGFRPAKDTIVLVCGLPGVYDKLCGPRNSDSLPTDCILSNLGYTKDMVLKF